MSLLASFALTVAVQFPLLIGFGYSRSSVLATILPFALVMIAVARLHLDLTSLENWLPLIAAGGAAALVGSAFAALAADRRRSRLR